MDEAGKQLAALLAQFGQSADRVWPQMVATARIRNLLWLFLTPALLGISVWVTVWLWRAVDRLEEDECNRNGWRVAIGVIGGIAIVIQALALVSEWPKGISAVLYPEAEAVLLMLRELKK